MALAVILFSFLYLPVRSQCPVSLTADGEETIRGVINNSDNYYRNLIVQDVALASQQPLDNIILRFRYDLHFSVDQCDGNQAEIKVHPLKVDCFPLFYRDIDISSSVKPERADLIFHIFNEIGLLTDSVLFLDIPVELDSGLYTISHVNKLSNDGKLTVKLSRVLFHFTRKSYNDFRDAVLAADRYFASSALADSVLLWARKGPLQETDTLPLLILRRWEIERAHRHISGSINPALLPDIPELSQFRMKVTAIRLLLTRYGTLERNQMGHSDNIPTGRSAEAFVSHFLDLLDHYHALAYKGDFRNAAFLEELASPVLSNGFIINAAGYLSDRFRIGPAEISFLAERSIDVICRRAAENERSANQIRALEYYESALRMAILGGSSHSDDSISDRTCSLKKDILSSYLGIARKAFLRDNPGMVVSYYRDAASLVEKDGYARCGDHLIPEFESWLFGSFYGKSGELLDRGQYRKALAYLEELNSLCISSESLPCPQGMPELIRLARNGLYKEVLAEALQLMNREEFAESELKLNQAVNIRLVSGYAISRDVTEARLEGVFRQKQYEEYLEQGTKNLNWREYDIALYYFNKAAILEKGNLPDMDPQLDQYRKAAANVLIQRMMSDTKAKAISYDFEGYEKSLENVYGLMFEYGFLSDESISIQYDALKNDAGLLLCNKAKAEYEELLSETLSAKESGDYILARKLAEETVQYSLDHLQCGIADSQAWYEKVILEPMAVFQAKDEKLDNYSGSSRKEFVAAYQDLRNYYNRNQLLIQGISLETLHQKVMRSGDAAFLKDFLDYYISQPNLQQALDVLKKIRDLDADPEWVSEEQKALAALFARRDIILTPTDEPWKLLENYVGQDRWFGDFRWSYRMAWISGTGWNLRYWPFIWKK